MTAAEVLAQHQLGEDVQGSTCNCGLEGLDYKGVAAHQLDALKAASFAVVELPAPSAEAVTFDEDTRGLGIWEFGNGAKVCAWSDGYMVDEAGCDLGVADFVRAWAVALLAAVEAVEAKQS